MRPETIDYIKRHPYARTSAIVARDRRNQKTAEIQRENEAVAAAGKRVNEYRDSIGYVPWTKRAKDVLSAFAKGWWAV